MRTFLLEQLLRDSQKSLADACKLQMMNKSRKIHWRKRDTTKLFKPNEDEGGKKTKTSNTTTDCSLEERKKPIVPPVHTFVVLCRGLEEEGAHAAGKLGSGNGGHALLGSEVCLVAHNHQHR